MNCWIDPSCECFPQCFRDVEFDSSTNTVTRIPDSRPMCPLVYWAELDRDKEDSHLDRYLGNTDQHDDIHLQTRGKRMTLPRWLSGPPRCPICNKRMAWVMTETAFRTRDFITDNGRVFWCGREGVIFQSAWIHRVGWGPLTRVELHPMAPLIPIKMAKPEGS